MAPMFASQSTHSILRGPDCLIVWLDVQVSAKEKLRNYVFSKIDDDDAFDNSSAKGGDKQAEELHYSQW